MKVSCWESGESTYEHGRAWPPPDPEDRKSQMIPLGSIPMKEGSLGTKRAEARGMSYLLYGRIIPHR
nr:hypothetical protein Iba_chr03aCG0740 [Ipomoea batatas]